jgi:hypothetical protein
MRERGVEGVRAAYPSRTGLVLVFIFVFFFALIVIHPLPGRA